MYVFKPFTRVLAFLVIATAVVAASAQPPQEVRIRDGNRLRTFISVAGAGEATAPPDMATIRTGVTSQAETAKEALNQNNAAMQKVLGLLKEQDIADKDVQTAGFNMHPVYEHDPQGRTEPKVVAYRVTNEVQVKVRKLASLGDVLDALVQAGSNQISGVAFDVDASEGILNEARSRAIRNAKSRADVYAQAAGVSVGRVLQISEQPLEPPRPMQMGAEFRAAASSVPIATGEQEFRVTVNVVYELRRREGE
jgi:uncharacterized protein YggE